MRFTATELRFYYTSEIDSKTSLYEGLITGPLNTPYAPAAV